MCAWGCTSTWNDFCYGKRRRCLNRRQLICLEGWFTHTHTHTRCSEVLPLHLHPFSTHFLHHSCLIRGRLYFFLHQTGSTKYLSSSGLFIFWIWVSFTCTELDLIFTTTFLVYNKRTLSLWWTWMEDLGHWLMSLSTIFKEHLMCFLAKYSCEDTFVIRIISVWKKSLNKKTQTRMLMLGVCIWTHSWWEYLLSDNLYVIRRFKCDASLETLRKKSIFSFL